MPLCTICLLNLRFYCGKSSDVWRSDDIRLQENLSWVLIFGEVRPQYMRSTTGWKRMRSIAIENWLYFQNSVVVIEDIRVVWILLSCIPSEKKPNKREKRKFHKALFGVPPQRELHCLEFCLWGSVVSLCCLWLPLSSFYSFRHWFLSFENSEENQSLLQ